MERCADPRCRSCGQADQRTAANIEDALTRLRDAANPYAKEFQGNRAARRAYQREFGGRRTP